MAIHYYYYSSFLVLDIVVFCTSEHFSCSDRLGLQFIQRFFQNAYSLYVLQKKDIRIHLHWPRALYKLIYYTMMIHMKYEINSSIKLLLMFHSIYYLKRKVLK